MNHSIEIVEKATIMGTVDTSDVAVQFVVGTAPVNLADNPYDCTNVPVLVKRADEFSSRFGYCEDFEQYTLCQSAYVNFSVVGVAPVVFVNVLDPTKHVSDIDETSVSVVDRQAVVKEQGLLKDKLVVKANGATLEMNTDYILSFDDDGYMVITLLSSGAGEGADNLTVTGKKLDPSKVTNMDIIGGYNAETGVETGLSLVRKVYPMFSINYLLITAPGWSHIPVVGAAIQAICEDINGLFSAECILDLDTEAYRKYDDVAEAKAEAGYKSKHAYLIWPMVRIGGKGIYGSASASAVTIANDIASGNVPNVSPSNKAAFVDAAILKDGTPVYLDIEQAKVINKEGVATFLNVNGWKLWGNYSACYPDCTDPKDAFWCIRRFFSWHGNNFITRNFAKLDKPLSVSLVEAIVDEENIICNSYVAREICAGAQISFVNEGKDKLVEGNLKFEQKLAPYTPAQYILNELSFDPQMIADAFARLG